MASAIDTARPERPSQEGAPSKRPWGRSAPAPDRDAEDEVDHAWRWPRFSRLARLIITLNLLGLLILVSGALVLNELRRGLVNARLESLSLQGETIVKVMDQAATLGEPFPQLQADRAARIIEVLHFPSTQRVRLFDAQGNLLADSWAVADRVDWRILPPPPKPGQFRWPFLNNDNDAPKPAMIAKARRQLGEEVARAMGEGPVKNRRVAESGKQVVSVSIPIQHVAEVLGVLTLEASDVDAIIARERAALVPFILIAVGVTLLSSLLLSILVAQPMLRLAQAADRVRLSRARSISLPDLSRREDEIGDLSRSLEDMTDTLSQRMDAIERFAADVAHEIRNPLTSIRSAVETLELVKDPKARERLMGILKQDVSRLDRLIGDISNASRLDAELSREQPRRIDLNRLIGDIVAVYDASLKAGGAPVRLVQTGEPLTVSGREGPLGQVFRNLIDNARSFSPPDGEVLITLDRTKGEAIIKVEDSGPGIPPENLETVFERFYTSRPKGQAFGGNSGLGLSIARQIVEAHGGRVRAENRAGGGALFTVVLPEAD
ncbi:two-component system sensor histidine kinase ChvG [Caulobacter ginsengisoli]|uniref:histidine kinase n=1 Tax=Caulobacter ginsengisoli TaxID=400775 RepID=A0ABU0IUD8_9CAUL|nr:ATP-binding protein [Caulobacter ginsengisoli]MDQ0465622.1 two-component system sensor histidine kinase ChvG [Caulobacter ginsengisoli]